MVKKVTPSALEQWLHEAHLPPDGRLPSERELAAQFSMGRAEVRKILARLEARGLVWRHIGKGTFRVPQADDSRVEIDALAARTNPVEAMEARLVLEPEIAQLAASNATVAQIHELCALSAAMVEAPSWTSYQRMDAEFHCLLAEACGNRLLTELYRILSRIRVSVVWAGLAKSSEKPPPDYHSFAEHQAVVTAIENRDRNTAGEAMRRHLRATLSDLTGT